MDQDKSIAGDAPNHLMHIVDVVRRRFGEAIRDQLADHPYTDVRRSELRILLVISPSGTSLTALAELTGMTKQSLSEFIERLQQAGYVTTQTNPDDRRAKLIRPSERGETARDRILTAGRAVEDAWRDSLGAERYDAMRDALTALAEHGSTRSGSDR